ncbi:MAG: NAD-dependent epimerase/dehydratase family protein [Deltaproteobacteria bacterium]|nr:NAD-dependent epimerase/dehydratase family protein [Deltaproteobacteria bacterium]
MRIGIVGAGLNCDKHIQFISDYPGAEIVGLADRDKGLAEEKAKAHGIAGAYSSIDELIAGGSPEVIHIVTPPVTHYSLAKTAIEARKHVLVEKPMTLNATDAAKLFESAERCRVKLCTMHNHFFDPCMEKAREFVKEGKAGQIIGVESYYGLNTSIDAFRKYPAPDVLPWLYSLPGGVFHDFMPHPLYVMLPYTGRPRRLEVVEKSFGELPQNISDELRVLVDGDRCLGTLTFSFAAKPHLHFLRIIGTRMMVHVDFNQMTTVCHPLSSLPKVVQKATYNLSESWQLFSSTVSNVWNFGRGKLKPYHGMKTLIHQFYDSIKEDGEVPVSKTEALLVMETMDEIFKEVKNTRLNFNPVIPVTQPREDARRVLVTGATGFLGKRLVEVLVQDGFAVRALARKLSNIERLKGLKVEIHFGDVASLESIAAAFKGVDYVVHAAADTTGNEEDGQASTVQGTRNVVQLCEQHKVRRLVYISSCSVYGVAGYEKGHVVTEDSALERWPERRGPYSHAKLEAEKIVVEAMRTSAVQATCLRPGTIYGPGGEVFTPIMGFNFGTRVFGIIGNGQFVLPFVYIDNLVHAIVTCLASEQAAGKIYNVVDPQHMTKKQYAEKLLKRLYPKSLHVYIPYSLLYVTVGMQELMFRLLRRKPFLTRYRLTTSQKKILYDSSKISKELRWNPPVTVEQSLENLYRHELHRA